LEASVQEKSSMNNENQGSQSVAVRIDFFIAMSQSSQFDSANSYNLVEAVAKSLGISITHGSIGLQGRK